MKSNQMFVVPVQHGKFELRDGTEPLYGGEAVAHGSQEACEAAARLFSPDNWQLITCVTPNGRIDGHGTYGRGTGEPGKTVCMFCGK